eukprot:CAMPEP_0184726526 /NCGR_PEP_ID=MMETSP0314-20130426/33966_1 /TAXON_ID=38298 /ORGANISM="Rhodella maculata, Strain CCMP 736" /LENGTH=51 /DNA_ID=CAMNT_0027191953 /DNA_START=285 /DNA_END=437 /DNA_ORIENTATION=+
MSARGTPNTPPLASRPSCASSPTLRARLQPSKTAIRLPLQPSPTTPSPAAP